MDRTSDFLRCIERYGQRSSGAPTVCPSPFILKSNELMCRLASFEDIVDSSYESYVDFHRFLPLEERAGFGTFGEDDRIRLDEQIVTFISTMASQIQELNKYVEMMVEGSAPGGRVSEASAIVQFRKLIISNLLNSLSSFSLRTKRMQQEHSKQTPCPRRLLCDMYESYTNSRHSATGIEYMEDVSSSTADGGAARSVFTAVEGPVAKLVSSVLDGASPIGGKDSKLGGPTAKNRSSGCGKVGTGSVDNGMGLADDFAQRYVDEVAPAAKLREYDAVARAQKDSLLREARQLQDQFSEGMRESHQLERTVNSISSMIAEFSSLIEGQSDVVETVGQVSADVTKSVQQTDEQLLLTLQRTQSHQWSMIGFILGMTLLLVTLDFITP